MEGRKQRGRANKIRGSGLTESEQAVDVIREREEKMMERMEEDRRTRNWMEGRSGKLN